MLSGVLFGTFLVGFAIAADTSRLPVDEDQDKDSSHMLSLTPDRSPVRSGSGDATEEESGGEEAPPASKYSPLKLVRKPILVRRNNGVGVTRLTSLASLTPRPLSPNSMRASLTDFSGRFASAQDEEARQSIAEDAVNEAQKVLLALLARLVISEDGERFAAKKIEVEARVRANDCGWDYMQAVAVELQKIAKQAHAKALEEDSSATQPSEVSIILNALRRLQESAGDEGIAGIKASVLILIEANKGLFEGKNAALLEVLKQETPNKTELITTLISVCEVIQGEPSGEESSDDKKEEIESTQPTGKRYVRNAVVCTGLIVGVCAILVRVLIDFGMISY